MKRLIVKGDFVEISKPSHIFIEELITFLKEKSNDYFRINFINEFIHEEYSKEYITLTSKLFKWASALDNFNKDFVLKDLQKHFNNNAVITYFEDYLNDFDKIDFNVISEFAENLFDEEDMTDIYNFKETKDLWIQSQPCYCKLELELLKGNEDIAFEIEDKLKDFAKGKGNFTITSVIDKDTMESLDINNIFEYPSFETDVFGNYIGYDIICNYLSNQLQNGIKISKLEINYINKK